MLMEKQDQATLLHDKGVHGYALSTLAPKVDYLRCRHKVDLPSAPVKAQAQIHLLCVHEKALVEQELTLYRSAPQHEASACQVIRCEGLVAPVESVSFMGIDQAIQSRASEKILKGRGKRKY